MAVAEIIFDQTPQLLQIGYECPDYTCDTTTVLCNQSCDYSSQGNNCASPDLGCCTDKYCLGYSWVSLQPSTTYEGLLQRADWLQFRFQLSRPCQAVQLVLDPIFGDPDLFVQQSGPVESSPDISYQYWWSNNVGGDSLTLCPSDPMFAPGTVYGAVNAASATRFRLTLILLGKPVTPAPVLRFSP